MDKLCLYFFAQHTKQATGMDYAYLKARKELSSPKPDPVELEDVSGAMHRKHIKGLVQPRLSTPMPKMQGTKKTPLSIAGNPRERLGLKRNQS